ncbi:L,D-transpeptidase family protein [Sphingomonas sp. AR_OL41]|uniref:L,D-transpeptidase family protein n=1 Tax=Sphingomonas sp. AR_OL41 TaxID=3042729 RepID=UPI002480256F|nr:L,D-transpeptidase family protein [Sphingomonas sp. AR_OL41]MDH7973115.1 L,D-transpeptidase family protein [Sphingomonas sp. AR_OL41]
MKHRLLPRPRRASAPRPTTIALLAAALLAPSGSAAAQTLAVPSTTVQQLPAPTTEPQPVPEVGPLNSGTVLDAVKRLKPGEFIWAPQVAPAGPTLLIVNIATQRAVLYRNSLPVAVTTVSTGRPGHLTPTGVFTILQKEVTHFSSIYDSAPMPYMQRLTWGGVALHGGQLPGYPASHGCIRLPKAFAKLLYGETRLGMTVMVVRSDLLPIVAPVLAPLGDAGTVSAPPTPYVWQPEIAPTGPVSIIVSSTDQRVLVLRNGKLIGSATALFDAPLTRPWLFVLQSVDAAGQHWTRLALPGQDDDLTAKPSPEALHVAEPFKALVAPVLMPGTTVILTPDALNADGPVPLAGLMQSE